MGTKKWYASKAVWLGVLMVAGGIAEYLVGVEPGASIGTMVAGALTVIVRFLTNSEVTR